MSKFRKFLKTTVIGGVTVVLPVVLTVFFLRWMFNFIISLIQPITETVFRGTGWHQYLAHLIVFSIIVAICFIVGLVVKTRLFVVPRNSASVFGSGQTPVLPCGAGPTLRK